ncbi:MAG: D-amino-acid transaminase [Gammaproteobacteria bacterium]|nr:D-amino-acid transaminase [Gammaproteobacteria bacterium]
MSIVYLNGKFCPADDAKISVFDRGFLLGDGVYEVIPAYAGNLFRLQEHLERLQSSLDAIRLENPLSFEQWAEMLNELIQKNYDPNLSVYLQVTRGAAVRDHAFPKDTPATIFAMCNVIHALPEKYYEQGVTAITVVDNRWQRCDIKAISLLANVLLRQQAVDQDAAESILIRDGKLTEGAASNVFAVIDGEIRTPAKSQYILPGITRDLVVELARSNGLAVAEKDVTENELLNAEEIWVSSSTKEILPITSLNGQIIGDGKPGKVWQQMSKIYREYKQSLLS